EEKITGRFQESDLEIENIKKLMNSKHNEKKEQADTLEMIKSMLKDTCRRIDTLGIKIEN
ncbi:MAG: hypothetical protein U9N77_14980, partial [Thermodesulfobacteriota bacterium]|nr:hypothetical protein [Thermodesulfobacteriota bacterium]